MPVNWNGPGAQHGKPGTYAKGCRCPVCTLDRAIYGALKTRAARTPRRLLPPDEGAADDQ